MQTSQASRSSEHVLAVFARQTMQSIAAIKLFMFAIRLQVEM